MIDEKEILRRRDMREVFTFTIDPADAKDFDDAISFQEINDTTSSPNDTAELSNDGMMYQIGVHIADVSFYVKPGTKVDEDAYKRGTSVYLVDRVIPMLPEELCNDKCSLRPGEDKLCMSVVFTMNEKAEVLKYKICRTVIRSDVRLNYEEAQEIIESQESPLSQALTILNKLAQKLRAERIAKGALTIEQEEMRFKLDGQGNPVEIYFEQPNEAHHLIEEFMLLANKTVAKAVGSGRPFVYRVHDLPDGEKLDGVKRFAKRLRVTGYGLSDTSIRRAIEMLTIRAQAKAVYSTYNIGHYGLAFSHYTHFTSPIRRYPDLMVHRLVEKYLLNVRRTNVPCTREELEVQCEHCSACEQEATQAERDSIKLYQTMWMTGHVGEELDGHISAVTDFGLFVQLDESRCEGLVHISKIGKEGDYWQYDAENYRLVCKKRKSYGLGDKVRVKVVKADVNKAQIDFELVEKSEK